MYVFVVCLEMASSVGQCCGSLVSQAVLERLEVEGLLLPSVCCTWRVFGTEVTPLLTRDEPVMVVAFVERLPLPTVSPALAMFLRL